MRLNYRPLLLVTFALLATAVNARAVITWKKFRDQHGSSVEIPVSLVQSTRADFGLAFESPDHETRIDFFTTTEARPGFPGNDPQGDMNLRRSDCDTWPPSYLSIKPSVAAYSCRKSSKIDYYVSKYNRFGSVTLRARYPVSQKAIWNAVVAHMAASMRQVPRVEVR